MITREKRRGINALMWAAHAMLTFGVVALLLVGTIWAVPMALVARDPRLLGTVLVGLGLAMASVALYRVARRAPRRPTVVTLASLAVVSLAVTGWTYAAAGHTLEAVTFANPPASLSGTLLLPARAGPHPAVVFLHGSGPEHRAISFHIAAQYARAGIAALIYDKRGSGASLGGHPRDPYAELAADALAAVRFLRQHDAIDPRNIGLWGLSEGGWTAPLAASMAPDQIAFLVVVSGGGANTEDEDLYSIQTHLEDQGIGPEGIERALELRRRVNAYYRTGEGRAQLQVDIRRVEEADWFRAADGALPRTTEVYRYGTDEWRAHMAFLDFDALPLLEELDLPMLFIHGELDRSYPAALSAAGLADLASDPGRDVSVVTYPGADHAIMTGLLPWPRYADGYIEHMVTWVAERFAGARP